VGRSLLVDACCCDYQASIAGDLGLVAGSGLVARPVYVRLVNLIVAPLYLAVNIGFMAEATEGWDYYLGGLLHTGQPADHLARVQVAQGPVRAKPVLRPR